MNFKEACQAKFDKGHKEHQEPWDAEHIDVKAEIRGECCDLYNYALLLENKALAQMIQWTAEEIWKRMK